MSRTDLRNLFDRHKRSDEISRALAVLAESGLARCEKHDTDGRPADIWISIG